MSDTTTAITEPEKAKKNNASANGFMTEEQAKAELDQANAELEAAQERVKKAKDALRFIQGNPREAVKNYDYKVDDKKLKALFESGLPIRGINDLFRKVLTLIDLDTGEEFKPDDIQISERIRKEGMKKLERYCSIHKESPRKFYIKALKNMDVREIDDKRTLKRHAEIAELREKIARSERETNKLKEM